MGFKDWFNDMAAQGAAMQAEKASTPKPAKAEVKRVTLDIARKKDAKKLAALVADGWEILSEHKRGLMEWSPGQIDYVLTRKK